MTHFKIKNTLRCAAVLAIGIFFDPGMRPAPGATESTITGEVIDLMCYIKEGAKAVGEKHKACALACSKNGLPLAILEKETKQVYFPIETEAGKRLMKNKSEEMVCSLLAHNQTAKKLLDDYIAQRVTVTGTIRQGESAIKLIEVKKIELAASKNSLEKGNAKTRRSGILNFYSPEKGIATAGQPSSTDLEELARQGYKSILNLRTSKEGVDLQAEAAKVKELGMSYYNIPVDTSNPTPVQAEEFLRIISNKENRPMVVHCASANRVGAFWMIYRVLEDRWNLEEAEKEAKEIGLKSPPLRQFALDYIQRHKK